MAETLVWDDEVSPIKAIPNDLPKQEDGTTHHYHWDTYNITHKHKGHSDQEYLHSKESKMDGINSDKVNINLGEGGGGGMQAAALVAALGQRNQGNDNAALIAALGQRNEGHRGDDGFGLGGGGILGLLAILGLLRGRGGLGGDDGDGDGCARTALSQTILEGVGDIRAQVPQSALEIRNALCQEIGSLALGTQQGFANTKDAVQAGTFLLSNQINNTNQNVLEQGCQTRAVVLEAKSEILTELKNNRISQLEDEVRSLRSHDHVRDSEIRISQNVNQQQFQTQQQRIEDDRFNRLFSAFNVFGNQVLAARQNSDIVNLGTMTASGTQAAANTQVR